MSGPKVDYISIEQLRAMELEAERTRNANILRDAISRARAKIAAAKAQCLNVSSYQADFLSEIRRIESEAFASITATVSSGYPAELVAARQFNAEVQRRAVSLLSDLDVRLAPITQRVQSAIQAQQERQVIDDFVDELSVSPIGKYGYFSTEFVQTLLQREAQRKLESVKFVESSYTHMLEDARACLEDIQLLVVSDSTDAVRKASLSKLAHMILTALRDFQADSGKLSVLEGALSTARPIISEMKTHQGVMEELYIDCLVERQRIEDVTGGMVALPQLWEFREENELESRLAEFKECYRHAADDAYIAYALESVMRKHGYNVSKSVCLAQGGASNHKMFLTDRSDVGIHTLIAANGSIVMEIAAVDDGLRGSDDGVQVERVAAESSYDRLRLVEQQQTFCDLHPELLADLAEYGVLCCAKSDKPALEDNSVIFRTVGAAQEGVSEQRQTGWRTARHGEALVEREAR